MRGHFKRRDQGILRRPPLFKVLPNPRLKLLDQCREVIRIKGFSYRTQESYVGWIRRYVRFCRDRNVAPPPVAGTPGGGTGSWRHPKDCGAAEVRAFPSHLAAERQVAASTQRQALNALVFLYRQVLGMELEDLNGFQRVQRPPRVPAVLSRQECLWLFAAMEPRCRLIAKLLYGSGLRLMECLRLRVMDVDFKMLSVTVRDGKGGKDRTTMLPERMKPELPAHVNRVKLLHEQDLTAGLGRVHLPHALAVKYPNAGRELSWQWVLPSKRLSEDPRGGESTPHPRSLSPVEAEREVRRRHHVVAETLQKGR